MTMCLFFHPDQIPSILTDCIVTNTVDAVGLTPSSLIPGMNGHEGHLSRLVSKYFFLDEHSVVGFSGNVQSIRKLAEFFPVHLKIRPDGMRPMRRAGDVVDEFNSTLPPKDQVRLVGFSVVEVEERPAANVVAPRDFTTNTAYFNECFAVGTGAEFIIGKVREFDQNLISGPAKDSISLAKAIGLVGALNSIKIFSDGADSMSQTWGGYLQWTYYDLIEKSWKAAPDWAHFAYFAGEDSGDFDCHIYPKTVFSMANVNNSSLRVVVAENKDTLKAYQWDIAPGVSFDHCGDEHAPDWSQYRPQIVTVCLICNFDGQQMLLHRTLEPQEMQAVKFETESDVLEYGIDSDLVRKFYFEAKELYFRTPR